MLVDHSEFVVTIHRLEAVAGTKPPYSDGLTIGVTGLDLHTFEPVRRLHHEIDPPGEGRPIDRLFVSQIDRGDKVFPCRPYVMRLM